MRQKLLEPGRDGCDVQGAVCEAKNFIVLFLSRFYKVISRIPPVRNTQPTLVLLTWDFETPGTPLVGSATPADSRSAKCRSFVAASQMLVFFASF